MGKLPAFQFYPGDWLKDPALRRCSKAAKGMWADMLCLAFECEDRGIFAAASVPWQDEEIAEAVGGDRTENLLLLRELLAKGVCSRNQTGAIFSRRMVRDEKLSRVRAANGSLGGSKSQAKRQAKGKAKTKQTTEDEVEVEDEVEDEIEFELEDPVGGAGGRAEILAVFAHYRTFHQRAFKKPSARSKEWKLIAARFSEGYTLDDLKAAIDGNHRSPFHSGLNEQSRDYHNLELIMRDGSKVRQFIDVPEKPGIVRTQKEKMGQAASEQFIAMGKKHD